ncbi:MAG: FdtA/QdtA family cupin domain-containing protein [Bacteriovoracia bacterium]
MGLKTVKDVKHERFKRIGTEANGYLVALEELRNVPFDIKRIFYVYGTPGGALRGKHAHKECQQFLICIRGRCDLVFDDGKEKRTLRLDSPDQGAYLPPSVWGEQTYLDEGTMLMVLTDKYYDESDYLRDYDGFLAWRRGQAKGARS